ncbi:MAG: YfhO family protein [Sphaerobacter sp.]|nr:YfhO family protein [Sphaerobacter sp.]
MLPEPRLEQTASAPPQPPRRWVSDALALLVVALLAVALNWQVAQIPRGLPASGEGSDLWTTHWGNAAYLKTAAATTGAIPLWNPHTMSGRPFAGDPLAALFYPPIHLVHLVPLRAFFLLLLIGHLALAGWGAYALARRGVHLGVGAALVVALAFMWSPRLVGHYGAGHLTMTMSAAWLPWVALALVLAIRERALWAAPAGLALGLAILAGHPQIAFYHLLMIAALTGGGLVWAARREPHGRARLLAALRVLAIAAGTVVIGTLIGAAMLVPAFEFTQLSLREAGLDVRDRLALPDLLRYLVTVPLDAATPHELTVAPGIPVLFLAPLAPLRRRWLAVGLLLGVGAVATLAMGAATPVLPFLADHVPGFGYFRAPARAWFLAALALSLLAGLGFDALLAGRRELRLLQPTLLLLLAANLWALDASLLHVRDSDPGRQPSPLETAVAGAAQGTRVYGVQRNLRQAVLATLDVELADGQDPLQIARYARFMQLAGGYRFDGYALAIPPFEAYDPGWPTHQAAQPNARLLGLLNVGVVVSREPLSDPALVPVATIDGTTIYRNTAVLPRAFLLAAPLGTQLARATPAELAALVTSGAVAPDARVGAATVLGQAPDGLSVQVDARQDAYLVVGTPWYPGWEARIDGRRVPLDQVGGVVQGVSVPAGTHTVEILYRPRSVWLGLALCVGGLLTAGVWTLLLAHHARRARAAAVAGHDL